MAPSMSLYAKLKRKPSYHFHELKTLFTKRKHMKRMSTVHQKRYAYARWMSKQEKCPPEKSVHARRMSTQEECQRKKNAHAKRMRLLEDCEYWKNVHSGSRLSWPQFGTIREDVEHLANNPERDSWFPYHRTRLLYSASESVLPTRLENLPTGLEGLN